MTRCTASSSSRRSPRRPLSIYAVLVFLSERSVAKADEAKALEVARERAVSHFGSISKVSSDQPIQSRAGAGHEFELTIERQATALVKARGRSYRVGTTIYTLLVASKTRNKDLPPDAGRFLDSLVVEGRGADALAVAPPEADSAVAPLPGNNAPISGPLIPVLKLILGPFKTSLLLGAVRFGGARPVGPGPGGDMAVATPPEAMPQPVEAMPQPAEAVSKPTMREPKVTRAAAKSSLLQNWGTEVDPDGDVELVATGKALTMVIPGSPHLLAPERDRMNAPRILGPMRGDFVATVRVTGTFEPSAKSTVKGLSSRQAGGLILWKDALNYLVLQRRASAGDDGNERNQAVLEEIVAGRKGTTARQPSTDKPTFLRLESRGTQLTAASSLDGKTWREFPPVATTWLTGDIQVGVIAVNTSTSPHPVTFEGYSLKVK